MIGIAARNGQRSAAGADVVTERDLMVVALFAANQNLRRPPFNVSIIALVQNRRTLQ